MVIRACSSGVRFSNIRVSVVTAGAWSSAYNPQSMRRSDVQLLNTYFPRVKLAGRITEASFEHLPNASSLFVTFSHAERLTIVSAVP